MPSPNQLDSAILFTPGRASYVESDPGAGFTLKLTEASVNRGRVAAEVCNTDFHQYALFAGGYPGVAQNWPAEHTPAMGSREADLMAQPLERRLASAGYSAEAVAACVYKQSVSNNSIGDVLESIRQGYLDPNDLATNPGIGIDLVAGALHAARFRLILGKALDLDPKRIHRVALRDPYGTPATEFRAAEPAPVAVAKELGAFVITSMVLRNVRPGVFEDLERAEEAFNAVAAKAAA